MATGLILDIDSFSTHDGPGIRTAVFVKGCPLSCKWCHSPESQKKAPTLLYQKVRCAACLRCMNTCKNGAITPDRTDPDQPGIVIDREKCIRCFSCAKGCYFKALRVSGREWDAEALAKKAASDLPFFENSGGGVTISGGEPFHYREDLKKAKPADRNDPTTFSSNYCVGYNIVDGVDTGDPAKFETFEQLMYAWKLQLDTIMNKAMEYTYREIKAHGTHGPLDAKPIISLLMDNCIDRITDLPHGGAKYILWHLMGEAVANAADAFAAIKKFVYEEKLLSLTDMIAVLKNNFAGEEGEKLRLKLIYEAPKFGNDDDYVDLIAKEMVDYFLERAKFHGDKYPDDFVFSPCIGTYSWIISIGKKIGASADGRNARDPIAANLSPVPGRDVSGPTAAIRSYLKMNVSPMAAGAPLDLRISKNGLEGEAGTVRIEALIKTFLQSGGNMMTLTITSAEELKKAIANPENYRGLRVRMGGWSGYFTLLSKASQELHLKRVEHGM